MFFPQSNSFSLITISLGTRNWSIYLNRNGVGFVATSSVCGCSSKWQLPSNYFNSIRSTVELLALNRRNRIAPVRQSVWKMCYFLCLKRNLLWHYLHLWDSRRKRCLTLAQHFLPHQAPFLGCFFAWFTCCKWKTIPHSSEIVNGSLENVSTFTRFWCII